MTLFCPSPPGLRMERTTPSPIAYIRQTPISCTHSSAGCDFCEPRCIQRVCFSTYSRSLLHRQPSLHTCGQTKGRKGEGVLPAFLLLSSQTFPLQGDSMNVSKCVWMRCHSKTPYFRVPQLGQKPNPSDVHDIFLLQPGAQ